MSFIRLILTLLRFLLAAIILLIYYPLWNMDKGLKAMVLWAIRVSNKYRILNPLYLLTFILKWVLSWPHKLCSWVLSILIPNGKI